VCHIFYEYLEHCNMLNSHSDAWTCGYEICSHSFNLDLLCTTSFYSFECQHCLENTTLTANWHSNMFTKSSEICNTIVLFDINLHMVFAFPISIGTPLLHFVPFFFFVICYWTCIAGMSIWQRVQQPSLMIPFLLMLILMFCTCHRHFHDLRGPDSPEIL
jgi:hypothetical protein